MAQATENPLISSKPSDSGTTVSLHPLVLLTASDQITRHRVRGDKGPLGGILLGQQKGREVTAEHAFAAAFDKNEAGQYTFKQPWLEDRIQQYRDVHKAPALDAVGWFTLCSESGPRPEFIPLQKQLTSIYNDNAIFLAIHPEAFESGQSVNQRLPITLYESLIDSDLAKDDSMQVDGDETSDLKFRPIAYTVETDEAEMIAINYVAKGAGSAAAVADSDIKLQTSSANTPPEPPPAPANGDTKGKKPVTDPTPTEASKQQPNGSAPDLDLLTPEEQDTISSIQTRLNSVKMLQSRLDLLRTFLLSLPPSYLTSQTDYPLTADSPASAHLPHLRNIQALLTRLSLLTPPTMTSTTSASLASSAGEVQQQLSELEAATLAQSNDVALTQLLAVMNHDVQSLAELGKKFSTMDSARSSKKGKGGGGQSNPFAGMGGIDDLEMQGARREMGFGGAGAGGSLLV